MEERDINERKQELKRKIEDASKGKLTEEEIFNIVNGFNYEEGYVEPEIEVTSEPEEFDKRAKEYKDIFEHSWAGESKTIKKTYPVIGDYESGIDSSYQYSNNGDYETPEEEHTLSDFSIDQIQVSVTIDDDNDHYNGNNIDEHREKIQIYLPEEKEYPDDVSFKSIMEHRKLLEQKETELSDLEKERQKIKELEEKIKELEGIIDKGPKENDESQH